MFLHHHRVLDEDGSSRAPAQLEAARWFKIRQQRISDWKLHEDEILGIQVGRDNTGWVCQLPRME